MHNRPASLFITVIIFDLSKQHPPFPQTAISMKKMDRNYKRIQFACMELMLHGILKSWERIEGLGTRLVVHAL